MEQVNQRGHKLLKKAGVLACLWAGFAVYAAGQAVDPSLEYQVKAAFLLNFTKFIDWPPAAFATPDSPIAICILGNDPFGRILDEIVQGEAVNARKVIVQRMSQLPGPQVCQVVFTGSAEKDLPKTLGSLGRGVLTVGEGTKFLRDGGMIAFVIENRRVRFDVNQTAAGNAELSLSSRMLSVARTVEK
jgi:hypothetical protein